MSALGRALIAGLTDLRDALKRGERLGAHYKVTQRVPQCDECGLELHRFERDDVSGLSCDGCGWSWDDTKGGA